MPPRKSNGGPAPDPRAAEVAEVEKMLESDTSNLNYVHEPLSPKELDELQNVGDALANENTAEAYNVQKRKIMAFLTDNGMRTGCKHVRSFNKVLQLWERGENGLPSIKALEGVAPDQGKQVAPWRAGRTEGNFKQRFNEFNTLLSFLQELAHAGNMHAVQAAALLDTKLLTDHNMSIYEALRWISNKAADGRQQIKELLLTAPRLATPKPAKKKKASKEAKAQGQRLTAMQPVMPTVASGAPADLLALFNEAGASATASAAPLEQLAALGAAGGPAPLAASGPTHTPQQGAYVPDQEHPPHKPTNSYMLFCQALRASGHNTDVLAHKWKALSQAEKEEWQQKYAREKAAYNDKKQLYVSMFGEKSLKEFGQQKKKSKH